MLIGEYQHTIDAKKRLSLPAKFRKEVGKKVVVTRGLDTCLFVFPEKAWLGGIAEKLLALPIGQADTRGVSRFFLSSATEVEVDTSGRILIADHLKDFAHLDTEVVLAGVGERIEIWDKKAWAAYTKRNEESADLMAQKLGELSIL